MTPESPDPEPVDFMGALHAVNSREKFKVQGLLHPLRIIVFGGYSNYNAAK